MKKIVAVLVLSLLIATGCSGGDEEAAITTTTGPAGPVAPLTGLPEDDEGKRERPVLTVKIDNHPEGRPQFGVDKADVIVEEKVEGDLSRLMALFQSQDSDRVGPVRSLRSTDSSYLAPVGGMVAYSGGIPAVRDLLGRNDLADVGADTHGPKYYKRRSGRSFEHSMYTDTNVVRKDLTPDDAKAAPPLFEFLRKDEAFNGAGVAPVNKVSTQMGTVRTAVKFGWTWDPAAGVFRRETDGKAHSFEETGQIGMKNVIIQLTPYRATQWRDVAGSPVDEAVLSGSGEAIVLSDGKVVRGTWTRNGSDVTKFTDSTGAPIKLQPGQTWLSLVPQGQAVNIG